MLYVLTQTPGLSSLGWSPTGFHTTWRTHRQNGDNLIYSSCTLGTYRGRFCIVCADKGKQGYLRCEEFPRLHGGNSGVCPWLTQITNAHTHTLYVLSWRPLIYVVCVCVCVCVCAYILTRSIQDSETSIDFVQGQPGSRRERVKRCVYVCVCVFSCVFLFPFNKARHIWCTGCIIRSKRQCSWQ